MRVPGPDHPITIEPAEGTVSIRFNDMEIARSTRALALLEASYPVVYYIPRDDVVPERLSVGSKQTYCPYKGDATHFDVNAGDEILENAAWAYDNPFEAMSEIGGHIAFYRDRVGVEFRSV